MEELLIIEVEKRAVLYDKRLTAYKNSNTGEDAWKEVSHELKLDIDVVKKRWRSLRDAFIKYHRTLKFKPSGSGAGGKKGWAYYDYLLFLIPHIEMKETIQSCSKDKTIDEPNCTSGIETQTIPKTQEMGEIEDSTSNHESENPVQHEKSDVVLQTETPRASTSKFAEKKQASNKRKLDDTDQKLLEIITKEADPDEHFLLSCLPILKRLNQRKNNLARIKIQQLLYDIEYDNMPNETYPQRALSSASTSTNLLSPTTGSETQIPWQPDESSGSWTFL